MSDGVIRVDVDEKQLAVKVAPIKTMLSTAMIDMLSSKKHGMMRIGLKSFLPLMLNAAKDWLEDFNAKNGTALPVPDVKAAMKAKQDIIAYSLDFLSGFFLTVAQSQRWQAVTHAEGDITYVDGFTATAPTAPNVLTSPAVNDSPDLASAITDHATPANAGKADRENVTGVALA